jgi:2-(1,2-epoxy-1,2-dihydrophenyl)acetyl-CoA isomerase
MRERLPMKFSYITVETFGKVVVIRLDAPERLNRLDKEMGVELQSALNQIEEQEAVRALIIIGSGRAFSAGGDIKGMLTSLEEGTPDAYMDELTVTLYDLALQLRRFPVPVIAAVNGYAVGAGMNLALCCDLIVAAETASFAQSFCKLALIPGFGGTHLLINQLPWQKAAEIAFFGEMVSAGEMHRLGLVNWVVPPEDLEETARSIAERLAKGPTTVYRRTKELFLSALHADFPEHLKQERKVQVQSTLTEDYARGVRAVNQKGDAEFIGR